MKVGGHRQHHVAGGIAIAMGEMVDAAIVVVEQTHKKLEEAQRRIEPRPAPDGVDAVKEVAPASFSRCS